MTAKIKRVKSSFMELKSFLEIEKYLEGLIPTTYKSNKALRLERIHLLLQKLGNPHENLKFVHIGGTAGKGSTATLLAQILEGQGLKVGLHISPHLETVRERLQINQVPVSEKSFIKLINQLIPHINEIAKSEFDSPTYFETLVAAAFLYFAQEKVDVAVVEVGLGGTLDATNVITPLVSVLTNVGLDHTEILGDTIEKIASDKVGIFKPKVPVITGVTQDTIKEIVLAKAKETSSEVLFWGRDFDFKIIREELFQTKFTFRFGRREFENLTLGTGGSFQIKNASLALATTLKLEEQDFLEIKEDQLRKSLLNAKVPGRFEVVSQNPLIILDGAHNPMKMEELAKSLAIVGRKFVFLVSFKKGKNIEEMLEITEPHAERIVVTEFSVSTDMGTNLATSVSEVDLLIQKGNPLLVPNVKEALKKAKTLAKEKNLPLVVTGSLYLVGEIRKVLIDKTDKLP